MADLASIPNEIKVIKSIKSCARMEFRGEAKEGNNLTDIKTEFIADEENPKQLHDSQNDSNNEDSGIGDDVDESMSSGSLIANDTHIDSPKNQGKKRRKPTDDHDDKTEDASDNDDTKVNIKVIKKECGEDSGNSDNVDQSISSGSLKADETPNDSPNNQKRMRKTINNHKTDDASDLDYKHDINVIKQECSDNMDKDDIIDSESESEESQDTAEESNPQNPLFICSYCLREFSDEYEFTLHTERHEKPIECPLCSRRFKFKGALESHLQGHMNKCRCNVCNAKFLLMQDLMDHMLTHEKDWPHGCNSCGKRFKSQQVLIAHVKTHGLIIYMCNICFKRFSTSQELNNHSKIQCKTPGYVCKVCGWRYEEWSHLTNHMRTHNQGRPNICNTCGIGFETLEKMKEHIATAHISKKDFGESSRSLWSPKGPDVMSPFEDLNKEMIQLSTPS